MKLLYVWPDSDFKIGGLRCLSLQRLTKPLANHLNTNMDYNRMMPGADMFVVVATREEIVKEIVPKINNMEHRMHVVSGLDKRAGWPFMIDRYGRCIQQLEELPWGLTTQAKSYTLPPFRKTHERDIEAVLDLITINVHHVISA